MTVYGRNLEIAVTAIWAIQFNLLLFRPTNTKKEWTMD